MIGEGQGGVRGPPTLMVVTMTRFVLFHRDLRDEPQLYFCSGNGCGCVETGAHGALPSKIPEWPVHLSTPLKYHSFSILKYIHSSCLTMWNGAATHCGHFVQNVLEQNEYLRQHPLVQTFKFKIRAQTNIFQILSFFSNSLEQGRECEDFLYLNIFGLTCCWCERWPSIRCGCPPRGRHPSCRGPS